MQRGGNRGGTPDAAVRRSNAKVDPTVQKIENLRKQREERRRAAEESKRSREAESRHNEKMGRPGDVDFQRMIDTYRADSVGREGTKAQRRGARCAHVQPTSWSTPPRARRRFGIRHSH